MSRYYILFLLIFLIPKVYAVGSTLYPTYAEIPPTYQNLDASTMINNSRVDFDIGVAPVKRTNGFTVIDPNGKVYVVDDIKDPKCAVYTTSVNIGDYPGASLPIGVEIISNVYIEEINFENCQ